MSNDNLKNCNKAIESLNMVNDIKVIIGKNPKQACRLIFSNGKNISVSAVTKVEQFIDVINANIHGHDNSIAVSKHNNYNADDEFKELQGWLQDMATYAKKCCYNYDENTLTDIIAWTIEDWGFSTEQLKKYHINWNNDEGQKAKKDLFVPDIASRSKTVEFYFRLCKMEKEYCGARLEKKEFDRMLKQNENHTGSPIELV